MSDLEQRLRISADEMEGFEFGEWATEMREAADTIAAVRADLAEAERTIRSLKGLPLDRSDPDE